MGSVRPHPLLSGHRLWNLLNEHLSVKDGFLFDASWKEFYLFYLVA